MAHRIFLALPIYERIQEQAEQLRRKFSHLPVRWIQGKSMHITLIPPLEEDDVEKVKQSLSSLVIGIPSFQIEFTIITYGPSQREFRLIWAEGRTPREIFMLKTQLERILGIQPSSRPFALHLTLARFRPETFSSFPIKKLNEHISWKQECASFVLLESHLLPHGSEYEALMQIHI